jgi:hypothetical protein
VKLSKLPPEDQREATRIAKLCFKESGIEEWGGLSLWGRQRDYLKENYDCSKPLSLRMRLNPNATFTVTGRWFDDGQFDHPYYEFFLKQAGKKTQLKVGFTMIY